MSKAEGEWLGSERRIARAALAVALLAVAATFAPAVRYGFVDWDDAVYVTRNDAVVAPTGSVDLADRLLTPSLGYPAPVTVATFELEHALFGLAPAVYHSTNVALHLAVCALLFALATRLGVGGPAAAVAVLVFGLHPAVAEPVSWVSGRKDLLAGVFCLSSTLEFLRNPDAKGPRALLPASYFLLGALSKPTSLFLVPLLFCFHWLLRRRGARSAARAVLPLLPIGAVVFLVSLLGQHAVHAVRESEPVITVLRDAWYALGFHLRLVFLLETPCVKHFPLHWPLTFEPRVDLLPFAAFALLFAGSVSLRAESEERRRAYAAALLWAGFSYLPSSNLIPLTRYLADSYVYLPLIGFALAAGVFVDRVEWARLKSTNRVVMLSAVVLGASALAFSARAASLKWSDDIALWSDAFTRYPRDYRLCRNLGNAYVGANQPERALELYENCAARLTREPFRKNIAIALFQLGRREEAARAFLEIEQKTPADPVVERYLGLLLERRSK